MAFNRQPLSKRPKPLSTDVADAIEQIVAAGDDSLPISITRDQIAEKLIHIAQTDEDGTFTEPTGPAANAMAREFINILANTATFQSGYKRYEARAERPVVPVVDYFFRVLGGNSIEDMSAFDITQSLPKRRGRVPVDTPDGKEWLRDEETNEVLTMGELYGIVVFPPNMQSTLLRAWLERRTSNSMGSMHSTVTRIEHARPNTAAIDTLKGATKAVTPAMRKALLPPKRRPT